MFKTERWWGVSLRVAAGVGVALSVLSVQAEDVDMTNTAPHTTRVKTAPKPGAKQKPAPTRPRPIQDETTYAAPAASQSYQPSSTTSNYRPAAPAPRRGQEQAVDLGSLNSSSTSSSGSSSSGGGKSAYSFHGANPGGVVPNFKFYYDFLLRSWKGDTNSPFTFESYHQRFLVEYTPTPDLQFMADVLTQLYFEMDYNLSKRVQVRWGRIWIPFDDLSPHAVFGGRINTSEFFQPNESAFLPNIWADMGFGFKFTLSDNPGFSSVLHAYVVNGFQSNFQSPVAGENGVVYYPDFSGTTGATGDNNSAKAFGARWHGDVANRFGFGVSVYHDTFTPKAAPEQKNIDMIGADVQMRPTVTTEIRLGYVNMKAGLVSQTGQPPPAKQSFIRGGTYIELGQKFGMDDRWKFLIRAGTSQNDNRVIDVSDKTVVGATLLKNFGLIEAQLTYWRDLKQVDSKIAYNYGAFRLVSAF